MARAGYSKYNAIKTEVDGKTFDSKKEARRYQELKLMERAKAISHLETQIPYVIFPKDNHGKEIKYVCDFKYYDEDKKEWIVEDVKGYKTEVYKLKKRLMAELYGIKIKET